MMFVRGCRKSVSSPCNGHNVPFRGDSISFRLPRQPAGVIRRGSPAPHLPWRIRLSAPGGIRTAWMMPFLPCGCPLDGFLLFPLYPFQFPSHCFAGTPGMPAHLVRLLLRFLSNKHRNQHSHYPYNEIDCRI